MSYTPRFSPASFHRGKAYRALLGAVLGAAPVAEIHARSDEDIPAPAANSEIVLLDKVEVTERRADEAQAALEQAKTELARVPGGTSLIDVKVVDRGRAATVEDLLKFQPGVFAQSTGGTDAIKISIRGSAINRGAGVFRHGTAFYFDGLAITGAGGTPYELFETYGLQNTEILLGANAFNLGALTTGGAINYVTHTGRTAPGATLQFAAGSFGWKKGQVAHGGANEKADYYVSITGSERDGFQQHTYTKTDGAVINFGYRLNDKVETRVLARNRRQYQQNAGSISLNQIERDPTRANPNSVRNDNESIKDKAGSLWIGSKTTVELGEDSRLIVGFVYHNYPQILKGTGVGQNNSVWPWEDFNTSVRYERTDLVGGHESRTRAGLFYARHIDAGHTTYNNDPGSPDFGAVQKIASYDGSSDFAFNVGNDFGLTEKLTLSSGLSLAHVKRDISIDFSDRPIVNPVLGWPTEYDYDTWRLSPRIGLSYEFLPSAFVFGNYSRTIDPPNSWNYSPSGPTNNSIPPLRVQSTDTVELGVRRVFGRVEGGLSLYRSWIDGELLSEQIHPGPPAITREFNASKTIHQGIEAGLNLVLWEEAPASGTRLTLRQAYTLNNFYYRDDPRFGGNELPGLPRHVYQAELGFEHGSGFYASVDLQHGSSYYADFQNLLEVPAYTILGLKAGYQPKGKNWSVYVDMRNLTDEHYVTAANLTDNGIAAGGRDAALFSPGDGRGIYSGVKITF